MYFVKKLFNLQSLMELVVIINSFTIFFIALMRLGAWRLLILKEFARSIWKNYKLVYAEFFNHLNNNPLNVSSEDHQKAEGNKKMFDLQCSYTLICLKEGVFICLRAALKNLRQEMSCISVALYTTRVVFQHFIYESTY